MNKTLSIIIPTWNRAECLKTCLSRIKAQDFQGMEIIVSDDGSTDNTSDVVTSCNDRRISYIAERNSGLPAVTRNRALKIASNELVAFCDSDDYWKENKLNTQLSLLQEKDVSAICSNAFLDQTETTYFNDEERFLSTIDLLRVNSVICSSMIVDRKIIEQCGAFDESPEFKAVEDYLLWLKVSLFTDIYYTNEPLIEYTTNSHNSVRLEQSRDEALRYQLILKKFLDFSIENGRYISSCLIYYFLMKSKLLNFLRRFK